MHKTTERRFQVWKATQDGIPPAEIAKNLKIAASVLSKDLAWVEQAVVFGNMAGAESPNKPTGDAGIDAMQAQLQSLRQAQSRFHPATKEWLKRNESISWLALKIAQLTANLPNRGQQAPSQYRFSAQLAQLVADVAPLDPATDPSMITEYLKSGRVRKIPCPCNACGGAVFVSVNLRQLPAYSTQDDPDDSDDQGDTTQGNCVQ